MALLGRSALIYRAEYPVNLSVSPAANTTAESFALAESCRVNEKARVTYTYTSDANITALKAVFRWLNSAGAELSRNEVALTPNTTATRTDEYTAPADTSSFQFGINATSGATAGAASFTGITERLLVGYAKGCTVSFDRDLVKEYLIGSDQPSVLLSGNKSFSVDFELLYVNDLWAAKILAGDVFDVAVAPDGWGAGKPLITLQGVTVSSWGTSIEQDGLIAESVSGEGSGVALTTQ